MIKEDWNVQHSSQERFYNGLKILQWKILVAIKGCSVINPFTLQYIFKGEI